jgi:hypothetical protein
VWVWPQSLGVLRWRRGCERADVDCWWIGEPLLEGIWVVYRKKVKVGDMGH